MTLGVFLPLGGSVTDLKRDGQYNRFRDYYLKKYSENFQKVLIFSWCRESANDLPTNCYLISNSANLHRYLYAFLIPLLHFQKIRELSVIRVMQLSGFITALLIKFFFAKPVVVTYGYDYEQFAKIGSKPFQAFGFRVLIKLLPLADTVIFPVRSIFNHYQSSLTTKAFYLPNGVDTSEFSPGRLTRHSGINILSVGRLEKQKDYSLLVKAIGKITFLKTKLTIIGLGSEKEKLLSLAHNLHVDLQIIDRVDHNKLPTFYRQADLFVSTSLAEGSAKSLIEAGSCGCLIVARDLPGNRELLSLNGKVGAVFFTGDESSLAHLLRTTSENKPLRQKLSAVVRAVVLTNFNISKLIKAEITLLRKVTQG